MITGSSTGVSRNMHDPPTRMCCGICITYLCDVHITLQTSLWVGTLLCTSVALRSWRNSTRSTGIPAMGAAELWSSSDPDAWEAALTSTTDTYSKHAPPKLQELNKWYEEDLPAAIQSRNPPHMTQQELVKLVEWKLSHGKWRPNLLKYAQSQQAADVQAATTEGLQHLTTNSSSSSSSPPAEAAVKKALTAITQLKGVGPATASAILAAADSSCPFMSDEALEVANKGRDYTVPAYCRLLAALRGKAEQLGQHPSGDAWTAVEVERCLYAAALAAKPAAGSGSKQSGPTAAAAAAAANKRSSNKKPAGAGKPAKRQRA